MSILSDNEARRKGAERLNLPADDPVGKPPEAWALPIPGEENTTKELVFEASQRLVPAGLSVLPIEAYEGSKSPDSYRLPHPHDPVTGRPKPSWSAYQIRRPSADDLQRWYRCEGHYGLAVLGGTVSGGLEVIDFDTAELTGPWVDA